MRATPLLHLPLLHWRTVLRTEDIVLLNSHPMDSNNGHEISKNTVLHKTYFGVYSVIDGYMKN